MGLVSLNYGFAGLDGAVHLAEDCTNAAEAIPIALITAIVVGFISTFVFVVVALYCMTDVQTVINTPTEYVFPRPHYM